MTYSDTIRILSGLMQLGVAWYALRLSRLCKSGRAGWLLFSALTLLALAYVLLPINPFRSSIHFSVRADVIMGMISLLLIAGMIHLELRFRKQFDSEAAHRQAHTAWEAKVGEQLEELNKTNDELRMTAASLQNQLGDTVRNQQQNEQMSRDLLNTSRQTETELRQTITELESQIERLRAEQEATKVSYQTQLLAQVNQARESARAEAITAVTAELVPQAVETSQALKSARLATSDLVRSRFAPLVRAAKILNDSARELILLCKRNPRGMQIHQHLLLLAQQLAGEQSHLLKKTVALDRLLGALETAAQQRLAELSSKAGIPAVEEPSVVEVATELGDSSEFVQVSDLPPQWIGDVTQTATEAVVPETEFIPAAPPAVETKPVPVLRMLS